MHPHCVSGGHNFHNVLEDHETNEGGEVKPSKDRGQEAPIDLEVRLRDQPKKGPGLSIPVNGREPGEEDPHEEAKQIHFSKSKSCSFESPCVDISE